LILLYNFKFKCENCDEIIYARNFKEKSLRKNCLCKNCLLCNKTFSFKKILNIENNNVVYQSNPEKLLIEYCNTNNILIKNGPILNYYFNKNRKYKVDFELPIFKILVEIKDNHIWHRNEIKSGKWQLKEEAANKWCIENNYVYKLIFDVKNFINDFF
jgi:hypothetical protein